MLEDFERFREAISKRLSEFKNLWKEASEERLYMEALFCLFTPQSKAVKCWEAVEELKRRGLLFADDRERIARVLMGRVRFHNTKAHRAVELKGIFWNEGALNIRGLLSSFKDPKAARNWLAENVKGYGYKEASHFVRNIGYTFDVAIIDRHILKNLKEAGIVEEIPKSISPRKYLELEDTFVRFAKDLGLSPQELDLFLWAKETGFIFK